MWKKSPVIKHDNPCTYQKYLDVDTKLFDIFMNYYLGLFLGLCGKCRHGYLIIWTCLTYPLDAAKIWPKKKSCV